MEIHSYRTVFELDRRIYRIDRLRLNPAGVPVRTLIYGLVLGICATVAARVPLLGVLAGLAPWYVRDLLAPLAGAAILTLVRVEGRPFHLAAGALLRCGLGPRRLTGLHRRALIGEVWVPPAIVMLPDGSDGRLRRLRCEGPGVVLVNLAHERVECEPGILGRLVRRSQLTLSELPGQRAPVGAHPIMLACGASLRVR